MSRHVRCPGCKRDTTLYVSGNAPAWRAINASGEQYESARAEGHWGFEADGDYGCGECGWEGDALEQYDPDNEGKLVHEIHPAQGVLL